MEVKSKFNKGDTIFYMHNDVPEKGIVCGISFFTGECKEFNGVRWTHNDGCNITYHLTETVKNVNERDVYATKEELQKAVFALL